MNEDLLELDLLGMTIDYQESNDLLEEIVHEALYETVYDGIDWGEDSDII